MELLSTLFHYQLSQMEGDHSKLLLIFDSHLVLRVDGAVPVILAQNEHFSTVDEVISTTPKAVMFYNATNIPEAG